MLIICSECGKEYSDQAKSCPNCGAITSKNRYISNNIGRQNINNNSNEGSGIVKILLIIIAIAIVILFIMPKTKTPDTVEQPTSDYNNLFSNRPSREQIANATTIDYRSLYKGANILKGKFYKITGEIVQDVGNHIYHVNMTENSFYYSSHSYYTDRIQISIIGTPSEILMENDIVSFTGEYLGNYTYTAVLGNDNTVPNLRVYAENLRVIGHTD